MLLLKSLNILKRCQVWGVLAGDMNFQLGKEQWPLNSGLSHWFGCQLAPCHLPACPTSPQLFTKSFTVSIDTDILTRAESLSEKAIPSALDYAYVGVGRACGKGNSGTTVLPSLQLLFAVVTTGCHGACKRIIGPEEWAQTWNLNQPALLAVPADEQGTSPPCWSEEVCTWWKGKASVVSRAWQNARWGLQHCREPACSTSDGVCSLGTKSNCRAKQNKNTGQVKTRWN